MTKTTRKALLSSVVALLVCLAMLVGTTFAWFTDTASTAVNTVKSGTLKVDIVDTDGNSIKDGTLSFRDKNDKTDIKWEPGVTFNTDTFKISNKGSLALKYKIAINGLDGDSELLKVIDFSVVNKTTGETVSLDTFVGHLAKGQTSSDELYIQGKMKTDAGNAYMSKELKGISLVVTATQDIVEYDSTTKDYDKNATFPEDSWTVVTTAEDLVEALNLGGNVKLGNDIAFDDVIALTTTTATPVSLTLDLNGNQLTVTYIAIGTGYTLTALDSGTNGKIVSTVVTSEVDLFRVDGGTLNIKSGTFVSNSTVETSSIVLLNSGSTNISGGTFSGEHYGLYQMDGSLTVSGGKITTYGVTCVKFGGTAAITGGELNSTDFYTLVSMGGIATISGGIFDSKFVYAILVLEGTLDITGGTFSHDPSEYVKSGYTATLTNGKYVVSEKSGSNSTTELGLPSLRKNNSTKHLPMAVISNSVRKLKLQSLKMNTTRMLLFTNILPLRLHLI